MPVVSDTDLNEETAEQYNLILVGSPQENSWIKQFHEKVPLKYESNTVVLGKYYGKFLDKLNAEPYIILDVLLIKQPTIPEQQRTKPLPLNGMLVQRRVTLLLLLLPPPRSSYPCSWVEGVKWLSPRCRTQTPRSRFEPDYHLVTVSPTYSFLYVICTSKLRERRNTTSKGRYLTLFLKHLLPDRSLYILLSPDRRGFPGTTRWLSPGINYYWKLHWWHSRRREPGHAHDSTDDKIAVFKYGSWLRYNRSDVPFSWARWLPLHWILEQPLGFWKRDIVMCLLICERGR